MGVIYDPVVKNGRFQVELEGQSRTYSAVDSAGAKYKMIKWYLSRKPNTIDLNRLLKLCKVTEIVATQRRSDVQADAQAHADHAWQRAATEALEAQLEGDYLRKHRRHF